MSTRPTVTKLRIIPMRPLRLPDSNDDADWNPPTEYQMTASIQPHRVSVQSPYAITISPTIATSNSTPYRPSKFANSTSAKTNSANMSRILDQQTTLIPSGGPAGDDGCSDSTLMRSTSLGNSLSTSVISSGFQHLQIFRNSSSTRFGKCGTAPPYSPRHRASSLRSVLTC